MEDLRTSAKMLEARRKKSGMRKRGGRKNEGGIIRMKYEVCYSTYTNATQVRLSTDYTFYVLPRQSGVKILVRHYLDDNSLKMHSDDENRKQLILKKNDKNAYVKFVVENLKILLIKKMETRNQKARKISNTKYYSKNERQKNRLGVIKIACFDIEFSKKHK